MPLRDRHLGGQRAAVEADVLRAGGLTGYVDLVRVLGGDPEPWLAEFNLSETMLHDVGRCIPYTTAVELLERAARTLPCPDFGMRLAALQKFTGIGALGLAIRDAPDMEAAARIAVKHFRYHTLAAELTFDASPSGQTKQIGHKILLPGARAAVQINEVAIALIRHVVFVLTAQDVLPLAVKFVHRPVAPIETYVRHLGVVPTFGSDCNAVIYPAKVFGTPLQRSDNHLQQVLDHYLASHPPTPVKGLPERTREAISMAMQSGFAGISETAKILDMHPRALQRRLREAGTSFEVVRDETRKRLAECYLGQPDMPIAHVAFLLGYADQSILSRSCKRWFGKSPLELRRALVRP